MFRTAISDMSRHVISGTRPSPSFFLHGCEIKAVVGRTGNEATVLHCVSAFITCPICYVICYYATAVYSSFWRFAGQATANKGSCELPTWRKLGRQL